MPTCSHNIRHRRYFERRCAYLPARCSRYFDGAISRCHRRIYIYVCSAAALRTLRTHSRPPWLAQWHTTCCCHQSARGSSPECKQRQETLRSNATSRAASVHAILDLLTATSRVFLTTATPLHIAINAASYSNIFGSSMRKRLHFASLHQTKIGLLAT